MPFGFPTVAVAAVDTILTEAADLIALEQIAKLNTPHLANNSALPSSLMSRFHKFKSLLPASPTLAKTLGRSATVPPRHFDPTDPS
ncbi:hypothetical protein E2562_020706 [Oryza meyeriana var. granulata]|uniref:Uncharacterized protein n=1 Tax=Oryza meyeriana var. granulata TaxID=110450 RepID=A0A6G1EN23_9ORYZ|nr:hypothetical protein E2562_020706 [Oryza meyeriana var. granulata]